MLDLEIPLSPQCIDLPDDCPEMEAVSLLILSRHTSLELDDSMYKCSAKQADKHG